MCGILQGDPYKLIPVIKRKILPLLLLILLSDCSPDDLNISRIGETIVDSLALTLDGSRWGMAINGKSFQQEALVSHKGYQYLAYYDARRNICLTRRKLPVGQWETIRFTDYHFESNDAHNTISMGICPNDGTIHLSFDHHGHPLHYRMSRKQVASNPGAVEWDTALFSPVLNELEKGKPIRITYPRFFQTPDGELQFCYRRGGSGNGDRMLVDYNSRSGKWMNTRQIDSGEGFFEDDMGESNSRCSYPNGYTYGPKGKLHATWVWRETPSDPNHDLVYVYSEDQGNTWLNNMGQRLGKPPGINSTGITVVDIPRSLGLMNTHGQAVDSKGRIHAVVWHCTEETLLAEGSKPGEHRWGVDNAKRYHHYWRDESGSWMHWELPWISGNRPKLFIDKQDNTYLVYGKDENLEIAAASDKTGYKDWRVIHTGQGPFVNEMLGDYYRWEQEGILSVMVQDSPVNPSEPTPLYVLDFQIE
jgi:hypothetical protein